MSELTSNTTYYSDSGYTCAICHTWVPYGYAHTCSGQPASQPTEVKWDRMSDVRIADALERIAAALELANERPA